MTGSAAARGRYTAASPPRKFAARVARTLEGKSLIRGGAFPQRGRPGLTYGYQITEQGREVLAHNLELDRSAAHR